MKRFHSCRQTGVATPRGSRLRRDGEICAHFTDNSAALQPLPRRKSVKVEKGRRKRNERVEKGWREREGEKKRRRRKERERRKRRVEEEWERKKRKNFKQSLHNASAGWRSIQPFLPVQPFEIKSFSA